MAASKQASKQHTHMRNAAQLVWGSLRLDPIGKKISVKVFLLTKTAHMHFALVKVVNDVTVESFLPSSWRWRRGKERERRDNG